MHEYLKSVNVNVQRARVRGSMFRVDPEGVIDDAHVLSSFNEFIAGIQLYVNSSFPTLLFFCKLHMTFHN